ncbi:VIT1/CCC1 transporter family protein [Candidatus Woesearchaeota archaeon]|nr:VIT1/CCC1 transporter family protein [Candidatus Woesearchaeota archaeon]
MITKALDHAAQRKSKAHPYGEYLKSVIYGGLDGTITTFAVVAGAGGASLSAGIVLILGVANLFSDGFSMATGDYLSSKAEAEYHATQRKRAEQQIKDDPKQAEQALISIYRRKGFSGKDAKELCDIVTKERRVWVNRIMEDEYNIHAKEENAFKSATITFCSFVFFGTVPLLTFIAAFFMPWIVPDRFLLAALLTGGTLFLLGALKYKITERSWWKSGMEMLFIGGIAALVAYGIGVGLAGLA